MTARRLRSRLVLKWRRGQWPFRFRAGRSSLGLEVIRPDKARLDTRISRVRTLRTLRKKSADTVSNRFRWSRPPTASMPLLAGSIVRRASADLPARQGLTRATSPIAEPITRQSARQGGDVRVPGADAPWCRPYGFRGAGQGASNHSYSWIVLRRHRSIAAARRSSDLKRDETDSNGAQPRNAVSPPRGQRHARRFVATHRA